MYRLPSVVTFVALVLSGCGGHTSTLTPHWDGKLTEKIPEPVRTALEQAPEFELLSLDPKHRDQDKPKEFLRRKVIGKTVITEAETRKRILAALDGGVRPDRETPGADCFDPRHAIRVQYSGKSFYMPICFECNNVYVFVDDQEKPLYFGISDSPKPVFDEVLSAAGITLAELANLQDELVHEPKPN